jgi:hypothetical protein
LVKNIKTASGKDIVINDAINMPLESFKLYGKTNPEYPDDYIRLEYIENRGSNAYIDTGVIVDTALTIEMDFQFLPDRAPGYNNPTGAISGTDGNYRRFHIHPGTQNQVGLQTYNADTTVIFQNYPYTTRAFTKIDMPNKTIVTDIEGARQSYDITDRGD